MVIDEQKKNMRLISHDILNGFGNGGEGLALKQLPGGRRVLFIAHETAPKDFTIVDVTDPTKPRVILQTELPHSEMRSNSLAILDDLLLVAYQTDKKGMKPAGMGVYDISDIEHPRRIGFFDASGPHSQGAHYVWFVDGRYAHLATGMPDFVPTHPKDARIYVTVDMADPTNPTEVGRWWLPGTRQGDDVPPPVRHPKPQIDQGFRSHNINVYPQRHDRAYVGYTDAGFVILDIADISHPGMISRVDYHPPFPGFTHTAMPLLERNLLIVTDEAIRRQLEDWPKLVWVVDIREETNPIIISTFPMPPTEEFLYPGARLGAHNIHENEPLSTAWFSDRYIVGSFFSAGVRIYDISNPFRPEEVGYYVPPAPMDQPSTLINDIYVDERGLVYAIDRVKGGLYILEMDI